VGVATWDAPPREGDPGYEAYRRAFSRFIHARTIPPPKGVSGPGVAARAPNYFMRTQQLKKDGVLDLGQEPQFKLMDFQACLSALSSFKPTLIVSY
jgi:chromodomain-helicase-DNA-binding protein 4